jgi:hypothetical protein
MRFLWNDKQFKKRSFILLAIIVLVNLLDTDIAALVEKDVELDTNIAALVAKDSSLDADIADLGTKNVALDIDITGVKNNIGELVAKDLSSDVDIAGVKNDIAAKVAATDIVNDLATGGKAVPLSAE